jgi:hypothetical protein
LTVVAVALVNCVLTPAEPFGLIDAGATLAPVVKLGVGVGVGVGLLFPFALAAA